MNETIQILPPPPVKFECGSCAISFANNTGNCPECGGIAEPIILETE